MSMRVGTWTSKISFTSDSWLFVVAFLQKSRRHLWSILQRCTSCVSTQVRLCNFLRSDTQFLLIELTPSILFMLTIPLNLASECLCLSTSYISIYSGSPRYYQRNTNLLSPMFMCNLCVLDCKLHQDQNYDLCIMVAFLRTIFKK